MEQQRPLLYLTLIFLGFMIWTQWQQDHAPQPIIPATSESTNTAAQQNAPKADTTLRNASNVDIPQQASNAQQTSVNQDTTSQNTTQGAIISIKTDTLDIQINTYGGDIVHAALPAHPISLEEPDVATVILDSKKYYSAQSGLNHNKINGQDTSNLAPTHHATYSSSKGNYALKNGDDTLVVPLIWDNGKGITVTKRYTFKRGTYLIGVEHEVKNNSGQTWSGFEYRQLRHAPVVKKGSFLSGAQAYVGPAYYDFEDGTYHYEKLKFGDFNDPDEKLDKNIKGGWAAMLEHYFVSAWIPQQDQINTFYSTYIPSNVPSYIIGLKTPNIEIASGASHTFKDGFYVGPKDQASLEAIANGLDMTVDYGIFSIFSKPIFWLLKMYHNVFGNWGWAIIFVTLTIKLLFFWPSAISYKSMAKMKKLAPKMKEMQERHKNDPQAKQKAMMEFYRKEKINPFGGCLPMLIQIPVFMGLYWVLQESVELRQAPWILWYKDLSIMDPYLILPLLMGASMWLQQKLNPPQMDPMQQKIFQWLPVVFTVMFLFFPAGLVLYWVVNNILSMAQQWYINNKIIDNK
ncbi:MAG TPA: membrane protein insertase YidC [Thiothrix sp.]|nr:membrane protein insertase YidC [Thiothrix sp.]